jgi:hypothetical protein
MRAKVYHINPRVAHIESCMKALCASLKDVADRLVDVQEATRCGRSGSAQVDENFDAMVEAFELLAARAREIRCHMCCEHENL